MARVEAEPGAQRPHLAALLPDLPEHARLAERAAAGEVAASSAPTRWVTARLKRRTCATIAVVHSLILVRYS